MKRPRIQLSSETGINAALEILYQDQDLIAVNKPAGLASIPGRGENDSVLERLSQQIDLPASGHDDPRLRIVHRLDKDTSGVLLLAKNLPAQRHLSHQFQNNRVSKEYLALVIGRPVEPQGEIDGPIGPHPASRKRMAVLKHRGRPARTLWKLEESFRTHSLLRVFPKTGKTHQIRVHLKHIGLPLVVDPLYNLPAEAGRPGLFLSQVKRDYRRKRDEPERALIDRLTLHAARLTVRMRDDAELMIDAPPPKDFTTTLKMLAKYARG